MRKKKGGWDFLQFIDRIDGIEKKGFSFERAQNYLRYYERWMKEGDVFFEKLKRFCDTRDLLDKSGLGRYATVEVIQKISENEVLLKNVAELLRDNPNMMKGVTGDDFLQLLDDSATQRVSDFLDIVSRRGKEYILRVQGLCGLGGKASLALVPLYRLGEAIEKEGGSLEEILPPVAKAVFPDNDKYFSTISAYWFTSRAGASNWWTHPGWVYNDFPAEVAGALVALQKVGKLGEALDIIAREYKYSIELSKRMYEGTGSKFMGDPYYSSRTNVFTVLLAVANDYSDENGILKKDKADLSKADVASRTYWAANATIEESFYYVAEANSSSGYFYPRFDYSAHVMSVLTPPDSDIQRLREWTKTIKAGNFLSWIREYDGDPSLKDDVAGFFFEHAILAHNRGVPSNDELSVITETLSRSRLLHSGRGKYLDEHASKDAVIFYSRPLGEIFRKAPDATIALSDYMVEASRYSFEEIIYYRSLLDRPDVQEEILKVDGLLGGMDSKKKREVLGLIFGGAVGYLNMREKSESLNNMLVRVKEKTLYFTEHREEILAFLDTLDYDRPGPAGFIPLFEYFCANGKDAYLRLVGRWKEAGLRIRDFDGNKRLFNLRDKDVERLKVANSLFEFYPSEIANTLMDIGDAEFDKWHGFVSMLGSRQISFPYDKTIEFYDLPRVNEGFIFLDEMGVFKIAMRRGSAAYDALLVAIKSQFFNDILAKMDKIEEIGSSLRARFDDWFFEELIFANPIVFLLTLRDLISFEGDGGGKTFFESQMTFPAPYKSTVYGRRTRSSHPFLDDDPGGHFMMTDYSLYQYAMPKGRYREIMGDHTKESLIDDVMDRFTFLPTQVREENKLYGASESPSRENLQRMPISKLIKIRWLTSALEDDTFRGEMHQLIERDYSDTTSEYGGYLLAEDATSDGIESLDHALKPIYKPAGNYEEKKDVLRELDDKISKAGNGQERHDLEAIRAQVDAQFDGGYSPPEEVIKTRFAWPFNFHLHATGGAEGNAVYAGPSGNIYAGDISSSLTMGDGLVFTRLGQGVFDVDFYGIVPLYNKEGNVSGLTSFVFDLGVYDDTER